MGRSRVITTFSASETIELGRSIAESVGRGGIIAFFGDLGAGKTTLIKGIVSAFTGIAPEEVCSPTFTYMNIYPGTCPVYHFDLYRLNGVEDFLRLGFEEYLFSQEGVCCIEWSEKIAEMLPEYVLRIALEHGENDQRKIQY